MRAFWAKVVGRSDVEGEGGLLLVGGEKRVGLFEAGGEVNGFVGGD